MAKEILYNGVNYPLNLNMLVFSKWEEHTGLEFSELQNLMANTGSFASVIKALALLYYGIKDGCLEAKKDFDLSFDDFIRGIDISDENSLKNMFSLIGNIGGSENKRQPIKKLATKK